MTATLEKDPDIKKRLLMEGPPKPPDIPRDGEHLPEGDDIPVRATFDIKEVTMDGVRDMAALIAQKANDEGRQPMSVTQVVNRLFSDVLELRELFAEERRKDPEAQLIVGSTTVVSSIIELGLSPQKTTDLPD